MGPFALSRLTLLVVSALSGLASTARLHEAIHHTVVAVSDLDRSLDFYVNGIGLDILNDRTAKGDWQTLFGTRTDTYRGMFLGNSESVNNGTDGVLHLALFDNVTKGHKVSAHHPQTGLFLVSFWVGDEFNATLARLKSKGFGGVPKIATFGTPPTTYASVRDPDGTQVLLVSNTFINSVGQEYQG